MRDVDKFDKIMVKPVEKTGRFVLFLEDIRIKSIEFIYLQEYNG